MFLLCVRSETVTNGSKQRDQRSDLLLKHHAHSLDHTMARLTVLVQVLVLVLVFVGSSECVRCFARYDPVSARCQEELGDVDLQDCCKNPKYGHQEEDGGCGACGPPLWSTWAPWAPCTTLCGQGVRQRKRMCYGIGECENPTVNLEMEPCNGTCCDGGGWGLWTEWTPCSVTCGGGGVRSRRRVCNNPADCQLACSGQSEQTETCPPQPTCPVHGGWSSWSRWSECSGGTCIDDQLLNGVPSRVRRRTCSNPAPSNNTTPHGNGCPGDSIQVQDCTEVPNCPVDGNWGAWSAPGPCSVTCGEGLQLSIRTCDQPAPKYGGRHCTGPSTQSSACDSPCPVDGFWSGWSSWGECSTSCIGDSNRFPTRTRHRSCSNPAPSSIPPGKGCPGDASEVQACAHLSPCPVDGGWSSWSPFSPCPVTCGVGLQVSVRKCDSPAFKHGGRPCVGTERQTMICQAEAHCPVDGVWSQWSPWEQCRRGGKSIRCQQLGGIQTQHRRCLHQKHNGSICARNNALDHHGNQYGGSEGLTRTRVCYDVSRCKFGGQWNGWGSWSLCRPSCSSRGRDPTRVRRRRCEPDYSEYSPTIGHRGDTATFFGTPVVDCGPTPDGRKEDFEVQQCINVPPCT